MALLEFAALIQTVKANIEIVCSVCKALYSSNMVFIDKNIGVDVSPETKFIHHH